MARVHRDAARSHNSSGRAGGGALLKANLRRMKKTVSKARFTAKLLQPAGTGTGNQSKIENRNSKIPPWLFLVLPKEASAKLSSRGMAPVEGTINGFPFQAEVE